MGAYVEQAYVMEEFEGVARSVKACCGEEEDKKELEADEDRSHASCQLAGKQEDHHEQGKKDA